MLDRLPYWRHSAHDLRDDVTEYILAIEAEAALPSVEALAAAIHLTKRLPHSDHPTIYGHETVCMDLARRILAALRESR